MKRILDCADCYIEERNWKMVAILKFCLGSLGILLGMAIPGKHKKKASGMAMFVFLITYISLMADFLTFAMDFFSKKENQ